MNFSSRLATSILSNNGYNTTSVLEEADLVLVKHVFYSGQNEQTVRKRLEKIQCRKKGLIEMKVSVLGCNPAKQFFRRRKS
jgi:tRNA-2-methylthio-N6-dimethylallyladenosine synthase